MGLVSSIQEFPSTASMRAWLITWEWMSESAEVADRIAMILPPRWSVRRVSDMLEQLYALSVSNVGELADLAAHPRDNPYRARTTGNQADMLECGSHPWLYARKVSDLTVTRLETGEERVSWLEPDRYQLMSGENGVERVQKGQPNGTTRVVRGPLSREFVRDRTAGQRKPDSPPPAAN